MKYFKKATSIHNAVAETFYEYAMITKVNGISYLSKDKSNGFSRIYWSCLPIGVILFGILMVVLLYTQYLQSPTMVTIGKPLSIINIPFPAVTICHPENVIDYKIEPFLKNM